VEVLRTELSGKHHTRLEQIIIFLIAVTVSYERGIPAGALFLMSEVPLQVVEVLRTELSEKHHTRLEQIIIYRIAVFLFFITLEPRVE